MGSESVVAPALIVAAGVIALVALGISRVLAPRRAEGAESPAHEPRSVSNAATRASRSVWLTALLGTVYAIQIVLLVPWAVSARSLPLFALVEMAVTAVVVVIGVAYARSGRLRP